jgi:hypothetical protein
MLDEKNHIGEILATLEIEKSLLQPECIEKTHL